MADDDIPPPPPEADRDAQPRHGSNHMYMRPRDQRARDAWAAERWSVNGWQYRQIANAMGISVSTAHDRVQRGLRVIEAPAIAAAERARAAHRARLEAALEIATDAMYRDHVHVSQGRVVTDDTGTPVPDDGPNLAAAGKVKELSESLRKLDGLDAPMRHELTMRDIDAALNDVTSRLSALGIETEEAAGAEDSSS